MSKGLIERLREAVWIDRGDEAESQLHKEAADTIEQQQSWIASLEAHARDADRMYKELETELAALQAHIKVLRDALELIERTRPVVVMNGSAKMDDPQDVKTNYNTVFIARKALAAQTDTTALHEMLAKEREACAKVCDEIHSFHFVANPAELCAINIRAMEDQ